MKFWLTVAGVFTGLAFSAFAQDNAVEAEKDWLEYYYENPSPERFVKEIKGFAEEDLLTNDLVRPALIGFMARVIRQNPQKLLTWYEELQELTQAQMQTFHTAMLYSRTKEADLILRQRFGAKFEEQKVELPEILKMPLDKAQTLDMLWGYYYATGSKNAIRRMVIAFRFDDAPDRPEGVNIPEGHRAFYKELPSDVFNMIGANAERHKKLRKILIDLYKNDKTLVPIEKRWLYDLISEFDPKNYPPKLGTEAA